MDRGNLIEISEGLVPGLELANWLEGYVDRLVWDGSRRNALGGCQRRVDLMNGLSGAAEAFRLSDRCDRESAERRLRSAVALIDRAGPG
jgi:hypothetical protein